MKKYGLLIAAMLLIMTSCNGASRPSQQAKTTTHEQQQKEKENKTMNVKELTLDEFKQKVMNTDLHPNDWVFEGQRPALIDFYATWCGPCKMTAPRVEQIAEKYAGKIDVYKVDVDKQEELAAMFGIQSIPSLLFIPMKGKPQMSVGAMSLADLDRAVAGLLQ
ncbi:MAG: thioredoxin [Prevotella sp.]|nr:thioredoxin [Prevotella sp.]